MGTLVYLICLVSKLMGTLVSTINLINFYLFYFTLFCFMYFLNMMFYAIFYDVHVV